MQPKAVSLSRTDAISPQIKWLMMGMLALAFVLMQAVVALAKPESLAPLAEKISPSVVNITTSTTVEGRTGPRGIVPEGSPFEDFFKEFRDRNNGGEAPAPRKSSALGSGFVISEDGFVVTNNHVIEGADEITIEFFTGLELKAEVIGTDPNTDIALLKVEAPSALPFVSFGDS
ncbi:MAG TPA: serine protease, partial [Sulfitobacter sp.]|nr:serine protease [Sulfitobacter sp.]